MSGLIDLTGKRFGKLTVVSRAGSRKGNALWLCQCDCGNTKIINGINLRNGDTQSCGCIQKEIVSERMKTHGATVSKRDRLYQVWAGMLNRTRNPKATNYKWYGERGINVCDEWTDYAVFKEWAYANGYNDKAEYGQCTLDRIDDDGNYCPQNCRWVSFKEQANNQKSNKIITYQGESHNLKQWSEILNINYSTFKKYIRQGKTISEILNK